jgi:hypothetical protein
MSLRTMYNVQFSEHKVGKGRLDKMKACRGTVASFHVVAQIS